MGLDETERHLLTALESRMIDAEEAIASDNTPDLAACRTSLVAGSRLFAALVALRGLDPDLN